MFSKDIWLGDNLGESPAFARDVKISGWTNVGDKTEGGYVGEYDRSCNSGPLTQVILTSVRLCDTN